MSNETESSLSKEATDTFRSSPPVLTQDVSFDMNGIAVSESESVAAQDAQQTPKPSKHQRMNSDDTERPPSAQHGHDDSERSLDVESEQEFSEDNDDDNDPAAQITNFDWGGLHERYHAAINDCSQDEAELMLEWNTLMEVLCLTSCDSSYVRLTMGTVLPRLGRI